MEVLTAYLPLYREGELIKKLKLKSSDRITVLVDEMEVLIYDRLLKCAKKHYIIQISLLIVQWKRKIRMKRLRVARSGYKVYNAGSPNFPRNFSRDSLITGLLMNSKEVLREQLSFSSELQGRKTDPYTGEEPGKTHHEYPGVEIQGHSTLYNACDTTALYLIGMETYLALTDDLAFIKDHLGNIKCAAEYITTHMSYGLFREDPAFCGADRFALKVTYWKDSQLPHTKKEPAYPIVYTLAHFQNARALRSAARLLNQSDLLSVEKEMIKAGLDTLWDGKGFLVAVDKDGQIASLSSDSLHVLAYLDQNDPDLKKVGAKTEELTIPLETRCGFRSVSIDVVSQMEDQYHGGSAVWVFEQALINYGARKFGLSHIQEVSMRVRPYLDTEPEILGFDSQGGISKIGCDPQLWTIAAKQYFDEKISPEVL